MGYSVYDFAESLDRITLPAEVAAVVRAWGEEGDGSEWEGGFVLALKDGTYKYVEGWCDYTGWGCQDGVSVVDADAEWRTSEGGVREWDENPEDLNRWLALSPKEREQELDW